MTDTSNAISRRGAIHCARAAHGNGRNELRPYIFILALLVFPLFAFAQGTAPTARNFDHLTTGFELTGAHRDEPCESCHVNAVFKGTPTHCKSCHTRGTRIAATPKPATHVLSTENCNACHATTAWVPASNMNHDEVRGSCLTCHNGSRATGKTPNHTATSQDCGTCHNTLAWKPAKIDHAGITGNCVRCHNSVDAVGKNSRHIASSSNCEFCHSTLAFKPATRVDHTQVIGGCFACHNGTIARAKGTTHIASDNNCDACHTSTVWIPVVRVDHAHVSGVCTSCHNGVTAIGKTGTHVPTTAECGSCHSTLAWRPAAFNHTGITSNCGACHNGTSAIGISQGHMTFPVNNFDCNQCHTTTAFAPDTFLHRVGRGYPGDHRVVLTCVNCHATNTDAATWRTPAYQPDCAGCHANNYKSDPHTKYGDVKYTVSELRNCAGACHVYTDATLTTIRTRRAGPEHRLTSNEF